MNENERQERADARRRRKRRQVFAGRMIITILLLVIVLLCLFLGKDMLDKKKRKDNRLQSATETQTSQEAQQVTTESTQSETQTETAAKKEDMDVLSQAERKAQQYDYDGAIAVLQASADFAGSQEMQDRVSEYEQAKSELVEYPLDQVTHVFYHTLIYDTSKAFDGDSKEAGYNQVMTTIDEFNKITQSMYDKGYVMVSLHDMCTVNEDGTVSPGKIMLPPGKKAFVLSQDDVSYYHYMDGDGMATKLIVDENGDIKNEYKEDDGSISVGDYDMVPLIDRFVEEHPDFAYHGHKGIIALTGYNGVLGYRTDIAYKTRKDLDEYQEDGNLQVIHGDISMLPKRVLKDCRLIHRNGWIM